MRGKLKTVTTCILILLTITLGTHITLQSTQTSNNYLLPFGLVYAFPVTQKNQNKIQGTSTNPNPLESFHTISTSISRIQDTVNRALMKLELQKLQIPGPSDILNFADLSIEALTLDGVQAAKRSVENFTGRVFMKWQLQKMLSGEIKPFTSPPSNESAIRLFYQFLSEKPECAGHFAQYDKLLSRENQLQTPEVGYEAMQSLRDVDFVVHQGEMVSELNETRSVNGTTYYVVTRVYSLNINGTTQNVTKITVATDDGTVIMDPYFRIDILPLLFPCYVWVFWWPYYIGWWPTIVLYGYDYWMHVHYTAGAETMLRLNHVYESLKKYIELDVSDWIIIIGGVGTAIGGLGASIIELGVITALSSVIAILGVFFAALPVLLHGYQQAVWANFNNTALYNFAKNPLWGWHEVDYFHDPMTPSLYGNPPNWDINSRLVFYIMNIDGGFIEKTPLGTSNWILIQSRPADLQLILSIRNFLVAWNLAYGFNHWVWLAPYQAPYPPPY